MFKIVDFEIDDIKPLLAEPINSHLSHWAADDYKFAKELLGRSIALTALVNDVPMVCAFFVEIWAGRFYMVVVLSERIRENSIKVYRGLREFIKTLPLPRIEFDVPIDLEIAHRRARFLGFRLMVERARKYLPTGEDASIYELVRS